MTSRELAEALEDVLRSLAEDEDGDPSEFQGATLCSFARAGLLTSDAGVVVTLADGSEFQISVTQSRNANDTCEDAP